MGPIKKILWKRKHQGKIDKCIHTIHLLQTLAALDLWKPTSEKSFSMLARVVLHNALKDMSDTLASVKLK